MPVTVGGLRFRVREKLRETDGRRAAFDPIEIDQAIADCYLEHMAHLKPPSLYTANAFTIAADANTFSLPVTVPAGYISVPEYAGDIRIQLASTGQFLHQRSREQLEAIADGDISTTGGQAPSEYALYEDIAQVVQGLCWPRSRSAELCHLFRTMVADDLREHATDMEAATIGMSRFGILGLVFQTSAELAERMTDEDRALRRLSDKVVASYYKRAGTMLYLEEARQHRVEASGRIQRWVS